MRKQVIDTNSLVAAGSTEEWVDLERLARVEVSSESDERPIEAALVGDSGPGWRAAQPGKQIIRLVFDEPISVRRVHLEFEEKQQPRTQQFSLRYLSRSQQSPREIVRQQYTFSLDGADYETEDYDVNLDGLTVLELEIIPDISGGDACATLAQMRLA